jgi:GNAT superfamily N-acetyltransferase
VTVQIRRLPETAATDVASIERITALINEVYESSEKGLWTGGAARTTTREVAELTRAGEIAVATLNERVVGCVRVRRLEDGTGEFGMLAADPAHRGIGIGRDLVRFAEGKCRDEGATVMQLELLVPQNWSHPSKDALAVWYDRIGYRVVRTGTLDEANPELAPLLATPCDFLIYHKTL